MPIHRETISYDVGGALFESVLVHSAEPSQRGLLMFPNALGLTAGAIETAEELAGFGYAVFVADLYGHTVRPTSLEVGSAHARKLREEPEVWLARMNAGLHQLREHAHVDSARIASLGFCFGGACALHLARSGADLRGSLSLHGSLSTATPARKGTLRASIFVLHGAEDPFVPESDVLQFQAEMRAAQADWQLISFGGAYHSFADKGANIPGKALYDAKVTRRAFRMVDDFVSEVCGR